MVDIVENWAVLEEYAGEKLGFYQLRKSDVQLEIRVMTGRCGFIREYSSVEDPEFSRIMDTIRKRQYIQISRNIRDQEFFKYALAMLNVNSYSPVAAKRQCCRINKKKCIVCGQPPNRIHRLRLL